MKEKKRKSGEETKRDEKRKNHMVSESEQKKVYGRNDWNGIS